MPAEQLLAEEMAGEGASERPSTCASSPDADATTVSLPQMTSPKTEACSVGCLRCQVRTALADAAARLPALARWARVVGRLAGRAGRGAAMAVRVRMRCALVVLVCPGLRPLFAVGPPESRRAQQSRRHLSRARSLATSLARSQRAQCECSPRDSHPRPHAPATHPPAPCARAWPPSPRRSRFLTRASRQSATKTRQSPGRCARRRRQTRRAAARSSASAARRAS
jgi:hypothetical protein